MIIGDLLARLFRRHVHESPECCGRSVKLVDVYQKEGRALLILERGAKPPTEEGWVKV